MNFEVMRNILLLCVLAMCVLSCNKVSIGEKITQDPFASELSYVTKSSDWFYQLSYEEVESFLSAAYQEDLQSLVPIYSEGGSLYCYIANYPEQSLVVASDRRMQPVLAIVDDSSFQEKDLHSEQFSEWTAMLIEEYELLQTMPEYDNEYSEFWRSFLKKRVIYLTKEQYEALGIETKSQEPGMHYVWVKYATGQRALLNTVEHHNIPHLIQTNWSPFYPWDASAPTHPTITSQHLSQGEMPVAVAQIIYYNHYKSGVPSFFFSNSFSYSYETDSVATWATAAVYGLKEDNSNKWDQMPKNSQEAMSNVQGRQYVSELIMRIGSKMNMKYYITPQEFSSTDSSPLPAFNQFDLQGTSGEYVMSTVSNNIISQKPVYMKRNNSAWVVDGYKDVTYTYSVEYMWIQQENPDLNLWEYEDEIDTGSSGEEHYNGELVYENEIVRQRYFRINWCGGSNNSSLVTIGSSGAWSVDSEHASNGATIVYNIIPSTPLNPIEL